MGLFSCMFLVHITIGVLALLAPSSGNAPPELARAGGVLFVTVGSVGLLFGWTLAALLIVAGAKLRRRRSHTFCLVIAGISCLFMPFGTVLGIFTIIVLSRPEVRATFAPAPMAAPSYPPHA